MGCREEQDARGGDEVEHRTLENDPVCSRWSLYMVREGELS